MSSDFISELKTSHGEYQYYSIKKTAEIFGKQVLSLPFTLKILLENLLRHEDSDTVTREDIQAVANAMTQPNSNVEIAFRPARVLMQDFTGVPAVVDLAAMRDAVAKLGGNPDKINPLTVVDLVVDHSVQVDKYASNDAFGTNVSLEFKRNKERYEFLKWGQKAFDNFRVVPPGTGICHQVNLEYLGKVVWIKEQDGKKIALPDTLVGTDSHTTMINGLAILGWGVGGIEAEATMLGEPISMVIPEVIGCKLTGHLKEGVTATDLVLTITEMLRKKGVVGKFVEFYGDGLEHLSLADRATIANMSPEYGATCGFFPIDRETIKYLKLTGRDEELLELVETYAKAQNLWRDKDTQDPTFNEVVLLDLTTVQPCIAGPKRPQDRIILSNAKEAFAQDLAKTFKASGDIQNKHKVDGKNYSLGHGDVVLAAITSCTNTSNPAVMIAAGLIAKKAAEKGMEVKPWVKTSLAPGSKVVTEYLEQTGLQPHLNKLGFNLVGYGCTTCIGNSGPLDQHITETIQQNDLIVASVLSGNRNFEGRIHPLTKASYLASPPLVVIYALTGTMNVDLTKEPIGQASNGEDVFLGDLWPTTEEINHYIHSFITPEMFTKKYEDVFTGEIEWQKMDVHLGKTYAWDNTSTYIKNPPYFEGMTRTTQAVSDIACSRILASFGDSITTDHISPAGSIAPDSPAGIYLKSKGIFPIDFNSYGSRRGNHEVMVRGTFANIRIKNELVPNTEGWFTAYQPTAKKTTIYDASEHYIKDNIPLIVIAGKEYGSGSSRDWAAKGPKLLGVKAVIAESFERIHRSNLVGMGIVPLTFKKGMTRKDLNLHGNELIDLTGLSDLKPHSNVQCVVHYANGEKKVIDLEAMIFTAKEIEYLKHGSILHYVIRNKLNL